jgi:hypothetical protein
LTSITFGDWSKPCRLWNTGALYSLPVDEEEIDRLQEEHFMLKELLSG